ncbi:hypothetical protein [bacterium endosymbiont of Bathymodiolus sp. 5 South]|jgi:hypothetical protein|uniref:hypothetical protein n=1 Tax=bacterium endosymbiont of Bathymodiolus sp. 5 South TaxID=1181670 RepID=UPI0010B61A4A|nr:hypothetical protein [bacterium endosymbiont of Bathymodiolus sp. 5 South]CAC9443671.1 hypothetical protein [uncultured Gammaproteobacteria bacterium]SSC07233.1 hypothetical protein BTURTLESOX_2449 [bacterium endosymbiont of Bathymodiolus sp. 5 South]VVH59154.1 hypothetical protein BSPCLSOX_1180 [uncultured Gammaproteobacteria bacterium]VVH63730.1 hypothetical protein BSPWISOX_2760 [uncultured Gammaproteobacteria bacterium]VVM18155.1 hypothetical protein BSPWISOXPB_3722 [uncultured Gammapro
MLPLSEELLEIIQPETEKPEEILNIPCGILKLYVPLDGVSGRLIDAGFLNFILTDKDGTLLGYPIKEIENTPIVVESMEGIKPNASWVVGIWLEEDTVFAVHWDGFTSRFDINSMQFIGQKFTH